jgi:hypothetical protein
MKPLFFLLLIIAVQKQCTQSETITLLDATSQAWMGGPAATHGTYYKIYFQIRDTTGYLFDSLWVNGKRLPVSFIRGRSPNDTLLLMANDHAGIRNPVTGQEVSNAVQAPFPAEMQASGLAGYFFKGERKYVPVPQWRQLKPVYYQ